METHRLQHDPRSSSSNNSSGRIMSRRNSKSNSSSPSSAAFASAAQDPDSSLAVNAVSGCATGRRHRSSTPLLWTILLAVCVALTSSLRARTPLSGGAQSGARDQQRSNLRRQLSVFGSDDRRPVGDPSVYPYSAVGLLRWSDSLACTASLIGDKFAVTAAECVLDTDGSVRASSYDKPKFLPGYTSESAAAPAGNARVTKVHKQSDFWKRWTQNTYVILELDAAVGQHYGVLQLPTLSDLDQSAGKTEVQLAGYDDKALDGAAAAMEYTKCTCYFPSQFNGSQYMLLHDCDTSGVGSPGSPLLVRYASLKTYIIGIHSNAIGSSAMPAKAPAASSRDFRLDTANRGVLGPFIQLHLEALVAGSFTGAGSSIPATTAPPTTKPPAPSPPPPPPPATPSSASSRARIDDGDLPTGPGSPSSSQSHSGAGERLTPAAAYTCIIAVCLAWACILFVAVRHVHRSGLQQGDAIE
ncbi:hypothetical protein PybrP1_006663 [[Pythium] brassicae (nom. inval.)]|nr:hypothetical protein PybrP1_006663 [[Pythium] brassicae (nom. inval.)]